MRPLEILTYISERKEGERRLKISNNILGYEINTGNIKKPKMDNRNAAFLIPKVGRKNPSSYLGTHSFFLLFPFPLCFLEATEPGRTRGKRIITYPCFCIQNNDHR